MVKEVLEASQYRAGLFIPPHDELSISLGKSRLLALVSDFRFSVEAEMVMGRAIVMLKRRGRKERLALNKETCG